MKRISRNYVDYLESVVRSLLAERERDGKGDTVEFEQLDLDRGPNDVLITYVPLNVKELMVRVYKEFVENGWK